jgi:DNA-binding MarR family transcriptional regulator
MNESVPALTQVLRVAHVLEARLEEDLARSGLSLAKLGVLRALAAADEPLTLGGVADNVGCVRSNVTQLIDRLEAEGLVRRVADPTAG